MAPKSINDLKLAVPEGVNAHLMYQAHNPPKFKQPVAKVGYWRATDAKGEAGETVWFDVDAGSVEAAQAMLDGDVLAALLEAENIAAEVAAEVAAEAPESKRVGRRATPKG